MTLGQKSMIWLLILFGFVITACQNEEGSGDYSVVSDLIADRNKARYEVKKDQPKKTARPKKISTNSNTASTNKNTKKNEELSSIILYEQDVKIVGSESQRTLAKGVAYINKKGQIVRIKILKE